MRRLLMSLLVLLTSVGLFALSPASASATETHPEWGSTQGHDAKLRKGCRGYGYDYTIDPPEKYWALETFLVGPGGAAVSSGQFVSGADPTTGHGSFRLCRRGTKGGLYTIRALVTLDDGIHDPVTGWLPDSTFRLRKPPAR